MRAVTNYNMKTNSEHDSISIAGKLERSRYDVLDLTLRNPLLNYRVLKAKGLEIVDEVPQEVYRILVQKGRMMYFDASKQASGVGSFEGEEDVAEELLSLMATGAASDPDELAARHFDNKLQTPYRQIRLDVRLRNTFRDAHLAIEEQGVNILYLALGMLKWYESESSDTRRLAPLVLIPVELTKAHAAARLRVRWTEEEIDANLSLETKLKGDFGIQLPKMPDAEELDMDSYFQGVIDAVSSQKRWSVDQSAIHLGFSLSASCSSTKTWTRKSGPRTNSPRIIG